ncbi:hypothetical protein D3C81_2234650 [compost metagenome]
MLSGDAYIFSHTSGAEGETLMQGVQRSSELVGKGGRLRGFSSGLQFFQALQ